MGLLLMAKIEIKAINIEIELPQLFTVKKNRGKMKDKVKTKFFELIVFNVFEYDFVILYNEVDLITIRVKNKITNPIFECKY
jgi:hypothetical protein